jgi:hypothetical protein
MGEAGVSKALEIIHKELDLTMAFCGRTQIDAVDKRCGHSVGGGLKPQKFGGGKWRRKLVIELGVSGFLCARRWNVS